MVKTKWYCETCDDVCEKRPFFNFYVEGRKNAVDFFSHSPEAKLLCVTCKHPANKHSFTFKKPKAEVA